MSIVAKLSIKRIADSEIIDDVYRQTNKTMTRMTLFNFKKAIKRDSFEWYQHLKQNQFEYVYEFKERINEIIALQRKHHEIIDKYPNNPQIQQVSLAELHKLNLTLSNYFDIAPDIIGDSSLSKSSKEKATAREHETIIV